MVPRDIADELVPGGPEEATTNNNGDGGTSAQVAKAGTWGLAGRSVLLVVNLAATPFTIRLLGPAAYGLWALIQAVVTWAALSESGMGAATTKYGAESYAVGDGPGEARVIWSGLSIVLLTTSIAALPVALGAHDLLGLLNVRGKGLSAGTWALRVACVTFILGALAGTINTSQQVRLRWKQYSLLNAGTNSLLALGIPVAIYLFSGGVVTAALVGLLSSFLYLAGLAWDAIRLQPKLLRPSVDKKTLGKLIHYGGPLTLAGVAMMGLTTGERFFISADRSTAAVAYYAVAMTLATTLQVFPEQLSAPLMPALAKLEAEGRRTEHQTLYRNTLAGFFLVLTPVAMIVALLAKPLLTLWAGPAYGVHSTELLLVAVGGVWVNAFAWLPWNYMLSAGKTKSLALLQWAELVPYLGAAWFFTAKWGALGAAVVWSARLLVDCVAMFTISRRRYGLPWLPLPERRVRAATAPVLLGAACLAGAALSGGLIVRSGIASALLVAYGSAIWGAVLSPRERRGVAKLLESALGERWSRLGRRWRGPVGRW